MKKQRISMEQYHYIGKYNPVAQGFRPLCNYYLRYNEETKWFVRSIEMPLYYWLPIVPFCFLLQLGCCIWDGGLKEFSFGDLSRHIHHDVIEEWELEAFEKCEEIYKKKIR